MRWIHECRARTSKPQDLTAHRCINIRLPTYGGIHAWEFRKARTRPEGSDRGTAVFNKHGAAHERGAGRDRAGIFARRSGSGAHRRRSPDRVLADWCAPFPGYHLYYPSRRQIAPAFALLVEALRYRR
jgi:hypothetical protein